MKTAETIMTKLLDWYKMNHYSQGDNYYINYSPGADLWFIGYTNDYPLQHGKGDSIRLTTKQVEKIISN